MSELDENHQLNFLEWSHIVCTKLTFSFQFVLYVVYFIAFTYSYSRSLDIDMELKD
jgi:hypothetical protein